MQPAKPEPNITVRKSALLPIANRKVLFTRSKGKKLFFNLGGKPELKADGTMETMVEALVREVPEEANVQVVVESLKPLAVVQAPFTDAPDSNWLESETFLGEFVGEPTPGKEVEELAWFTSADEHRTTPAGKLILQILRSRNLID